MREAFGFYLRGKILEELCPHVRPVHHVPLLFCWYFNLCLVNATKSTHKCKYKSLQC